MTAQTTLRAALDRHMVSHEFNEDGWGWISEHDEAFAAILEAMEQHRREALEEVEAFIEKCADRKGFINEGPTRLVVELQAKLAALKTSGLTTSEK